MRIWALTGILVIASFAYLGYRVLSLETRVASLAKELGVSARTPAAGAQSAVPEESQKSRLAAMDHELKSLRDDLRTLEEATGNVPTIETGADQRILSVVDREQTRLRDRQLEFHRSRWLKLREESLELFAEKHGLSQRQVDQLYEILVDEVDRMTELMRGKDMQEDPEKSSSELLALLEQTDRSAYRILAPSQVEPWDTARIIERRVLWPWLPFEKSTNKAP